MSAAVIQFASLVECFQLRAEEIHRHSAEKLKWVIRWVFFDFIAGVNGNDFD